MNETRITSLLHYESNNGQHFMLAFWHCGLFLLEHIAYRAEMWFRMHKAPVANKRTATGRVENKTENL